MNQLTDKQEMFCQEYLIDLNQTKAYQRAFMVENYNTARGEASRLASNPNIAARMRELMAERADRLNITQDWVLMRLKSISDKAMTDEPVLVWDAEAKEMVETGEYQFDSNGANKATELIGKHLGMFKDKVELSGSVQSEIPEDKFQQLLQAAREGAKTNKSE